VELVFFKLEPPMNACAQPTAVQSQGYSTRQFQLRPLNPSSLARQKLLPPSNLPNPRVLQTPLPTKKILKEVNAQRLKSTVLVATSVALVDAEGGPEVAYLRGVALVVEVTNTATANSLENIHVWLFLIE
jgi:hypothetical protein